MRNPGRIRVTLHIEGVKLLPIHGLIGCTQCYNNSEQHRLIGAGSRPQWKIEQPNGAWGSTNPIVVVLGFSRGARQSKPLPHDDVAFAGMRSNLTKIMQTLGLVNAKDHVDNRIRVGEKDFHFASLFRCSVSRWDNRKAAYSKSGGGILEKFLESSETREVAHACTERFLGRLPNRTKLVLLLGNTKDYVAGCKNLFQRLYPSLRTVNEIAYSNGEITWVHCIHAAAQGAHIPQWLAGADTAVGRNLAPAKEAINAAGVLESLRH